MAALKSAAGPQEVNAALEQLRRALSRLPPDKASALIREFLDSGSDVSTKLQLKLGAGGSLAGVSSLRVFLLDYLAQIDRPAAAGYAAAILASKSSADEWAVSLRNYALANSSPEGLTVLRLKTEEMLRHEPWQTNPSAGFLEAFDLVVFSRDTNLVPVLTDLMRPTTNRALAHAAFMALDRLAIETPLTVLPQLLPNTDAMRGREISRAGLFARADVQDPQQQALLEAYLLDPQTTPQELSAFAQLYPNVNYLVSNNLLTPSRTPNGDTLAARDRKALEVVETWLADPRFNYLLPQLQTVRARLQLFVQQEHGR
jgi:hypothetical protein